MKFTNGFWMTREEYTPIYAVEYHSHRVVVEDGLKVLEVYAPSKHIGGHGDTLNLPMLTFRFSAPVKGAIRTEIVHFKGANKKAPYYEVTIAGDFAVITDSETELIISSGDTKAVISKIPNSWAVSYYYGDKFLTQSSYRNAATMLHRDGRTFTLEQLQLSVSESIYGLGERFTPFVKNGQVVEMWNEDGGTASEIAYKNVPFYLSSRGYGVFVDTPSDVAFEIGSEKVERVQFSLEGQRISYVLFGGASMKEAIMRYTDYTGKPALPPAWSFGLWLSTSFTTSYDEATVQSFIDGMRERKLPLSVFHFDCCWMKDFHWSDFVWDEKMFPNPKEMLTRLRAQGFKICVWINPYIAQNAVLFDEGMAGGYLVKNTDGSVWQTDLWQAGMGLVDFTNPAACEWYLDRLGAVLDMGVDCIKTDFGERIPVKDVVYFDGSDPLKMHNFYSYIYNKTLFEYLESRNGKGQAVLFARSATAGGQQFPVHWGGDCTATALSMAESIRAGLSLSLCGFGFWSHDIGGFEQTATPDVYKRWVAFGMMSSHSRLHGSTSYRVPWLFDDESVDVLRYFTNLKLSLMPYLFNKAVEAHVTGVPTMRAMALEFEHDRTCHPIDTQYMLGDKLLVAPILNDQSIAEYYLPFGTWTNLLTGEAREGGKWFTEKHSYLSMPLYVRENSLLITGNCVDRPDYDYADGFTANIYQITDGAQLEEVIYDQSGQAVATVKARREGSKVHCQVTGKAQNYQFKLFSTETLTLIIEK